MPEIIRYTTPQALADTTSHDECTIDLAGRALTNQTVAGNLSAAVAQSPCAGNWSGVEAIDLSSNWLSGLPEDLFSATTGLISLVLFSNQLTSLAEDLFSATTALSTLYLNSNQLTSLAEGLFSATTGLISLILRSNKLTSLAEGLFSATTQLQYLLAPSNKLATFQNRLPAVLVMDLSDNLLRSLSATALNSSGLTHVILTNNPDLEGELPLPPALTTVLIGASRFLVLLFIFASPPNHLQACVATLFVVIPWVVVAPNHPPPSARARAHFPHR